MADRVRESIAAYGGVPRRMTVQEYYLAAEKGVFKPGERLELIDGEVLSKLSPQRSTYSSALLLMAIELRRSFEVGFHIRPQMPLKLDDSNEPEPDIVVVDGSE